MAELRRASTVLLRSKSISAFARDGYYIGTNYEVTGPKHRPRWRSGEAPVQKAAMKALCGASALTLVDVTGRPFWAMFAPSP